MRPVDSDDEIQRLKWKYSSGRKGDSVWINRSEGYAQYNSGELNVHINIPGFSVPEIPDLQILKVEGGYIPWEFKEVRKRGSVSTITFYIDEGDESFIREAVEFYDFLYTS